MKKRFRYICSKYPLVLASASPRRKRLLKQVGLPFRALSTRVDEDRETGKPQIVVQRLAEKKARAASGRGGDGWILGADTAVVMGEKVLGKPADRMDAAAMLSALSGREHRVITGFCLLDPSGRAVHSEAVITRVRFKWLTREEIQGYVDTGEPFGKAGGYAIQGIGAFLVEGITGSYTNVVGLPVCAVIQALLGVGALRTFPLGGL
ncbi:MAG: Maf family protein [Thermodesulfobacteriota bacterium]